MTKRNPRAEDSSAFIPSPFQAELLQAADPMAQLTDSGAPRGTLGEDIKAAQRVEIARLWGDTLLSVRHLEQKEGALVIGDTLEPLPGLDEAHTLVSISPAGEVTVALISDWHAVLRGAEGPLPLAERALDLGGTRELELRPGEQLVVCVGDFAYVIRLVNAAAKVVGKKQADLPFIGATVFTAFMAAMVGILAWTAPPEAGLQVNEVPEQVAEVFLTPPPEKVKSFIEDVKPPSEKAGERFKRKEGKLGKENGNLDRASGNPVAGRNRDQRIANEAGLFGAMQDSGVSSILGNNALDSGLGNAIGRSAGPKGVQIGTGLGLTGRGPGGGGTADWNFGTGTDGPGTGSRDYDGGGDIGPRGTAQLPTSRETIILGSLDRSQVDAVIRRNLSRFRYCYQRELTKDPSLGGKVTVKFTIAKDGSVSASKTKASSVGNSAVESCLNNTMMKLQFPQPKGDGIVIVSYPFLFSPG
ncbi:MAG: AgmX/PglI C-terminal domain-containing protein [Myxococcota bacterium]|nr:AgmX/PglI C-terminal domain-containing protein [Myxococcota bacterium]